MKNIIQLSIIIILTSTLLYSCKPDTTSCDNCENELITTLNVQLTDSATGQVTHFFFRDLDGDGANAPVQFDTIQLQTNHTYTVSLLVLDESKTPADTISNEIAEEANDHQFFFYSNTINAIFTYLDQDSNTPPLPLGLLSKWQIAATSATGKVRITLKHQPGIKDGNQATGETDLDVDFNTVVQ